MFYICCSYIKCDYNVRFSRDSCDLEMENTKVEHLGGCHCGKVRWRVLASNRPTGHMTLGILK